MVGDGDAPPAAEGLPDDDAHRADAAVAAPFAGGTTSGLTALDRARRGERGAVRVLVVGEPSSSAARLALAARAEGFSATAVVAAAVESALAEGHHHAIVVDGRSGGGATAGGLALVERLVSTAPAIPVVVVGTDERVEDATAWIDAGADEHLDDATVTPALLRRAVECAVARSRARDLRRRLEHADRLTTIGQLAAGVAHEVNNPAAFLLMNLRTCREYVGELNGVIERLADGRDVAARDGAPSAAGALLDEMSEMLDDNVRGVERIVAIVEALRAYVRVDGEQPRSVDVGEVCRDATGLVASRVRQHARLELALDAGAHAAVHADPRRLVQVVVNLLGNAADACEAAADRAPPAGHRVVVATQRRGAHVVIGVSDSGGGMTAAMRARVFEPFFTTKPRGRGTGLGLAISRDIVERYGGRIEVDSEPGHGSRFDVVLPIDPRAEAPPLASGSGGGAIAVAEATRRRVRVRLMIIDDEVALATALSRQLRRYHDVAVAPDGASALAMMERDPFDVVLCDVNMPGMDGIAVHAALARRNPQLAARVIFMTGGLFGDAARDALAAIGKPVLGKPVPMPSLLDAIDAARTR